MITPMQAPAVPVWQYIPPPATPYIPAWVPTPLIPPVLVPPPLVH